MKKLLGILVLGLLLNSCSEYQKKMVIENCADTEYSKEMANPIQVYLYITGGKWSNEFEKNMIIAEAAGFTVIEMRDHLADLLYKKDISESLKKSSEGVIDTFKRYNSEIKKFLNLSVDKKVNKKITLLSYRYFFERCELKQKETPNTFDALWRTKDIKYIDLSNLIKKFK